MDALSTQGMALGHASSVVGNDSSWTPAQAAEFHEKTGTRVVERDGTFWVSSAHGFWRPVDFLDPLKRQAPPLVSAIGYQHVVSAVEATGYLPKMLIEDVAQFDSSRWSRKTRRELRKCQETAQVQQAVDPSLLMAQGYGVWQDAGRRSGQSVPASHGEFERLIEAYWQTGPHIAVVGVQGNTLGGFLLAHVIGGRCYLDQVVISSAARAWPLGVGLYALALEEGRLRGAHVVDLGLRNPALPQLDWFKTRVGATLVPTPIYSQLVPGLALLLRYRKPATYVRWKGMPTPDASEV